MNAPHLARARAFASVFVASACTAMAAVPASAQELVSRPALSAAGTDQRLSTATATGSPSPQPTPTSHPDRVCPSIRVDAPDGPVDVNASFTITASEVNNRRVRFALVRLAPAPVAEVRSTTDATTTTWTLRLPQTTRLRVEAKLVDGGCAGGGTGPVDVLVPVRPRLTIAAERSAPRVYAFTGRVLPGRGQTVSLYRTRNADGTGDKVLTAQTRVRSDGTYRIDRRFAGSGRFGFHVAVGTSASNIAGRSPNRPTVIH